MKKWLLIVVAVFFAVFMLSQLVSAELVITNIVSATPSSGNQGETLALVSIVGIGTQFTSGVNSVDFGSGISVGTITVIDDTNLTVSNVSISSSAAPGGRQVTVDCVVGGSITSAAEIFAVLTPDWVIQNSETSADPGDLEYLYDVQALSEKTIYAVGSQDKFYKSINRGVTWASSNISGVTTNEFYALCFIDQNTGYAAGAYYDDLGGIYNPIIYKTSNATDATPTWTSIFSTANADFVADRTRIYDIFAANENRIWAAAQGDTFASPTKNFFYTTNGGTSWTTKSIEFGAQYPRLYGVSAVYNTSSGNYDVWVVGGWPGFPMWTPPLYIGYKSTDGGANFSPQAEASALGNITFLSKVYFINSNTGYAVGGLGPHTTTIGYGYIYKSTDGGSNWTSVTPASAPSDLAALHFTDANKGWVVGASGTILYTDDGGSSWTSHYRDPRALYGVSYYNDYNAWAVGGGSGTSPTDDNGRLVLKYVVNPEIMTLSTTQGAQGETITAITINGINFQGDPAEFSGTGISIGSTTVVGESANSATLNNVVIASDATLGLRSFTLTNPDSGVGAKVNAFNVVEPAAPAPIPAPIITSLTPATGAQGETLDLTIMGTGFQSDAEASFSGSGITVNSTGFSSQTQLAVNLSIASDAAVGARDVTVTNVSAGTSSTGAGMFTVTTVNPEVVSCTPDTSQHGKETTLSILGINFRDVPTIATFTRSVPPAYTFTATNVTWVNSTTIQCTIPTGIPIGKYDVEIDQEGVYATKEQVLDVIQAPGLYFYEHRSYVTTASGETAQISTYEIAYVLQANKNIEIVVIDPRTLQIVYRKRFTAGTAGGTQGYNSHTWDGTITVRGGKIGPGIYIVQMIVDGKKAMETKAIVR